MDENIDIPYEIKFNENMQLWEVISNITRCGVASNKSKETVEEYQKQIEQGTFFNTKDYKDMETDEEKIHWIDNSIRAQQDLLVRFEIICAKDEYPYGRKQIEIMKQSIEELTKKKDRIINHEIEYQQLSLDLGA